jgi:G3E family GTPase
MKQVRFVMVGGFLGAGKTTLLAKAAERLAAAGRRVGLITNDQAAHLVDTAVLGDTGAPVQEVSGGCFCCRFQDLVAAAETLLAQAQPDVLIGEPVGSCTDLSATVLQPIKQAHGDRFRMAPFSVLVDVNQVRALDRIRQSLGEEAKPRFPENVMYIYRKQLEEADVIVLNKADLLPAGELAALEATLRREFSGAPLFTVSALRGEGVEEWLEFVMQDRPAGQTIAEVDYDEYAAGEAALGWLNAAVRLRGSPRTDWQRFARDLLEGLRAELDAEGAQVAHVKLRLSDGARSLLANLTGNDGPAAVRGAMAAGSPSAVLVFNARVHVAPDRLREVFERSLAGAAGGEARVEGADVRSFAPARPEPTHRFKTVV